MKLSELLDELRENVLDDDAGLASGPDDTLWSDDTLIRYLNDAQRRFARLSLTLRDASTPEVVEVVLRAGVSTYTLHRAVRAVTSARYDVDAADLARVGHVTMRDTVPRDEPVFDANALATMTPGRPVAVSTDEDMDASEDSAVVMTVWPEPSSTEEGKIIHLRVARMPLVDLTLDDTDKSPEIPEEFHLDLCEWVGYRCHRTSDLDGASDKADRHEKRFGAVVEEARSAQRKKMFAPLKWNFGGNGFTWSN